MRPLLALLLMAPIACGHPTAAMDALVALSDADSTTFVPHHRVDAPDLPPPVMREGDVCGDVRRGYATEDTLRLYGDGRVRWVIAGTSHARTGAIHRSSVVFVGAWKRHTDRGVPYYSDAPGVHLIARPMDPETGGEDLDGAPVQARLRMFDDGWLGMLAGSQISICETPVPPSPNRNEVRWRRL